MSSMLAILCNCLSSIDFVISELYSWFVELNAWHAPANIPFFA
jgi:hypothetical protein